MKVWPFYHHRWFRIGWCRCCGRFSLWILDSEAAHEECWLEEK